MSVTNEWYLVSSHGGILFFIAANPDCTIKKISDDMSRTRRTIWGIIGDLRRKNMISVRKEGRRHHYTVNLDSDVEFTHPVLRGIPLRIVLSGIINHSAARQ